MEEKTVNIKEFEQAIKLLHDTLENKIKIKDDDGKDVEFLISYTEGDSQVMILNGTPNMVVGNVMSLAKKLPLNMKLDFLYALSKVLKMVTEEFGMEVEGSTDDMNSDLAKMMKIGKA